MQRSRLSSQRLVVVFMFGCLLFSYPVLALFDLPRRVFGMPLVFVYLFAVWAVLIGAMAWIAERGERPGRGGH
ncbi:MAG: hypothetical protein RBT86_05720 [Azospira sp.]|jgi:predicted permease|nr:hypothetical protein [Azospira sp.]